MVSVFELDCGQGFLANSRVPRFDEVEWLVLEMLMARLVFLEGLQCPHHQDGALSS